MLTCMQKALRTIVFCNKIETCRKVENVLKRDTGQGEQGAVVLPYHAAIDDEQRIKNLKVWRSVAFTVNGRISAYVLRFQTP